MFIFSRIRLSSEKYTNYFLICFITITVSNKRRIIIAEIFVSRKKNYNR